jgi:hypothetical protein
MESNKFTAEFESILVCRDERGNIVGMYVNNMAERSVSMYSASKMSLEEIKNFMNSLSNYEPQTKDKDGKKDEKSIGDEK